VIKIDYANGAGDGHVLWRLGQGGDFTVNSTDPSPWFSHQHDAHFIDDSTLILFDNGNTRRASDPTADSRGQVWKIDEQTLTATLVLNVDLGSYSPMFGSAQRLSNGDYSFLSGGQGTATRQFGQTVEVRPDGSTAYVLADNKWVYRSFRIGTLYAGVSDQLAGSGAGETSPHGDSQDAAGLAALVDGTTPSGLVAELPSAFQASGERLHALNGLVQAAGQIPPKPISRVFFGLANRTPTTRAGSSRDAVDQVFAGLGDGTGDALWAF
jgi:hypothetical protein